MLENLLKFSTLRPNPNKLYQHFKKKRKLKISNANR